jgi:hypothetical protein
MTEVQLTFLEILEPPLIAVDNYAAAVKSCNDVERLLRAELSLEPNCLSRIAAVEFAKWKPTQ